MAFYAVAVGRIPGIYNSWDECERQTKCFSNSRFRKFLTKKDAEEFIRTVQNSLENNPPAFSNGRAPNVAVAVPINRSCNVPVKNESNGSSWTIDSNTGSQKDSRTCSAFTSENYLSGVTVKKEPGTLPVKIKEEVKTPEITHSTAPLKDSVYYPNFKSYEDLKNEKEKDFVSVTETEVPHTPIEKFVKEKSKELLVSKENEGLPVESVKIGCNENSFDCKVPKKRSRDKENSAGDLKKEKKEKVHDNNNNNNNNLPVKRERVENDISSSDCEVPKIEKMKSKEKEIIKLETGKKKRKKSIEEESGEQDVKSKQIRQYDKKKETESENEIEKEIRRLQKLLVMEKFKEMEMEEESQYVYNIPTNSNQVNIENEEASPKLKQTDQILSQAINHIDVEALVLTAIENLLTNGKLLPQMLQRHLLTQTQENATQPGPSTSGLNNSLCNSMSNKVEIEKTLKKNDALDFSLCSDLKNVDAVCENLGLDCLEKRFDDCLKLISGIFSEMYYLRGEIKKKTTLTENSAQLSKRKDNATDVSTGVSSFKHNSKTQENVLIKALKPAQSLKSMLLPGVSRSLSSLQHDCLPDDTNSRKKRKLESDYITAYSSLQESSVIELDSS